MRTHAVAHRTLAHTTGRGWPVEAFLHFTIEHFVWLPLGGLIALVWANTRPESYFTFAHALSFAVNDIGMALFFALVTQEVLEATMSGGALHTWRRWGVPVIAAAGGAIGAAAMYLAYVGLKYEPVLSQGWLVACAFDIAFAYFVVRALFGRHAAVPFLLVMAVVTNAFGLILVAGQHDGLAMRRGGALLMLAAIALAAALRRRRVRALWPYLVVCGALSWWALYLDGLHPALALVPIVPFLPHAPRSSEFFADRPHGIHDSPRHLEHVIAYPVNVVLFLFGLVNAGILLTGYGTGTWALLAAAIIGRPLGVLAAIGIAVILGMHLPTRLHWRDLAVVALTTASGFTFAMFFATAVYPTGPVLAELKFGAILTGVGVPLSFAAARMLRVGRFHVSPHDGHHSHPPGGSPHG